MSGSSGDITVCILKLDHCTPRFSLGPSGKFTICLAFKISLSAKQGQSLRDVMGYMDKCSLQGQKNLI